MANANPDETIKSENDMELEVEPAVDDKEEPGTSKTTSVNGEVGMGMMVIVDRYGFLGGKQYTNPEEDVRRLPAEVLRKRELKWLDMFENWEKWMTKRFKKVKDRCRKGIPSALRARAWQYLCGSKMVMENNKGKFQAYLQQTGDAKYMDDITKDLHRQFPHHEMFTKKDGYGQEDLFSVLKAYTLHNPTEGYCQAHAPIAAVLLMHMPAEQAFWCLVAICEKYLPGYYSPKMEAIQLDGDVLFGLLKKTSPGIYRHIKKQRIEPIMYMVEWFMCVFTRNLPWSCVLRIWDIFLCEGVKVLFRIALVLLKIALADKLSECQSFYETLEHLRRIPLELLDEDIIITESLRLNVSERDMEREHQKQIKRRRDKEKGGKSSKKHKT